MYNSTTRAPRQRNRNFRGQKPGYSPYNNQRRRSGGGGKNKAQNINPERFINRAVTPQMTEEYIPQNSFVDFGFDPRLNKTIEQKNYKTPTPIQDQAIGHVLAGRDVVGLANTGTGKTAAFLLPIIDRLLKDKKNLSLIVVPTRELASQIRDEFTSFTHGLGLYSAVCVGGMKIGPQIAALNRNPHVIIATPGRLRDLLENHRLPIGQCRTVVLDEVDRMLDMGFVRDIKFFISKLPPQHQSLCFSATMNPQIRDIFDSIAHDPITISVVKNETSDHVEQDVIRIGTPDEKMAHLFELLKQADMQKVLIFGETKHGVQRLSDKLAKQGIRSAAIHGNKSQPQRQRALSGLIDNKLQVLVATDVAARGLDIPNVTHVINYDVPQTYDDYIHRIGRTGRAGQKGNALTYISAR